MFSFLQICDICSHALSTKSQLQIHMRKHTSEDHYVCDECGKSYKFLAPFLHHKIVHRNKFDYSCSCCNKAFRKMRDKVLHERTHSGGKIRTTDCDVIFNNLMSISSSSSIQMSSL